MKSRLALIFASVFVLLLLGLLITFNHQKPRVLVLHSYPEDGAWETAVESGIRRQLARNRQPIAIRWRSMLFSDQVAFRNWESAGERTRNLIDAWDPDLLITLGEEAQLYVGSHYAGRGRPTLLYAMTEDPASFGYPDAANVTGVREALPLGELSQLLRHLGRERARILALGIADATGLAEQQQVEDFDWGPHRLVGVRLAQDYTEWQALVEEAGQKADVLLVLSASGLPAQAGEPEEVDVGIVASWTERHATPLVVGTRESFVAGGGALAIVPSPDSLGERVMRQALRVLARPGKALPEPEASHDFLIALHPARLRERGLRLPTIYEQAARAAGTLYQGAGPQGLRR